MDAHEPSDQIYRALIHRLPHGVLVWWLEDPSDPRSLRLVAANAATAASLGFDPTGKIGSTMPQVFPSMSPARWALYAEIAGSSEPRFLGNIDYGDERVQRSVFAVTAFPLPDRCVGVLFENVTATRVASEQLRHAHTELGAAYEELKRTQSHLVQSEKLASLGQLVAGVAHEINNPLSFVVNNVAVLDRDVRDLASLVRLYEEAKGALASVEPALMARIGALEERIDLTYTMSNLGELVTRTREGLRRIQQIVIDLRDFARLDEGERQEADLNAGIQSTLNILTGIAKKHEVTLSADLSPLAPIACHPAKINQVVMNLLTNAIDATPPGGRIMVHSAEEAGVVSITVVDTGSGIEESARGKLFDPFFTTKPPGQGTGLGLSISYGIVKDHGGTIEVESTLGEGSRFTVHLPRNAGRAG